MDFLNENIVKYLEPVVISEITMTSLTHYKLHSWLSNTGNKLPSPFVPRRAKEIWIKRHFSLHLRWGAVALSTSTRLLVFKIGRETLSGVTKAVSNYTEGSHVDKMCCICQQHLAAHSRFMSCVCSSRWAFWSLNGLVTLRRNSCLSQSVTEVNTEGKTDWHLLYRKPIITG